MPERTGTLLLWGNVCGIRLLLVVKCYLTAIKGRGIVGGFSFAVSTFAVLSLLGLYSFDKRFGDEILRQDALVLTGPDMKFGMDLIDL